MSLKKTQYVIIQLPNNKGRYFWYSGEIPPQLLPLLLKNKLTAWPSNSNHNLRNLCNNFCPFKNGCDTVANKCTKLNEIREMALNEF